MGFIETSRALKFGSNKYLLELCGELDANLLMIEKKIGVQIIRRGNFLTIYGNSKDCNIVEDILFEVYSKIKNGKGIEENDIEMALTVRQNQESSREKEKSSKENVGNKKKYDPRAWLKMGRDSMSSRVVQACHDLRSAGKTIGG